MIRISFRNTGAGKTPEEPGTYGLAMKALDWDRLACHVQVPWSDKDWVGIVGENMLSGLPNNGLTRCEENELI